MAYKSYPITGPFLGVVDDMPAPNKPAAAFDDILNFYCRKGRLQTRPKFEDFTAPPDGAILRNALTFESNVNTFHSLFLTTQNAYYVTAGPTYHLLTYPGGVPDLRGAAPTLATGLPYGLAIVNNRVYFSNGSVKSLFADGSAVIKVAGDVPGAARYMGILAGHLVTAHTTEPHPGVTGSTEFPFRIRWSTSGDANDWTSFGSGFTDLLEVPGRITGFATLGRNGYVFRKNGITAMFSTGDGTAPFVFENVSNAKEGAGTFYPYSLAVYGNIAGFIADSDVYLYNGAELTPIGGKAKRKIFADIAVSTGDQITGFAVPKMGTSFDILSYRIAIPGPNIVWTYLKDEDTWQRETFLGGGRVTFMGNVSVA